MLSHFRAIEPTFVADVPATEFQQFSFVTVQKPEELKNKARQRLIRRHAKRDVDRARARKYKSSLAPLGTPFIKATNDVNELMRASFPRIDQGDILTTDSRHDDLITVSSGGCDVEQIPSLSFLKPLGAGRGLNPFATYPVRTTPRMNALFEYSKSSS
jgi:hypothetical protein